MVRSLARQPSTAPTSAAIQTGATRIPSAPPVSLAAGFDEFRICVGSPDTVAEWKVWRNWPEPAQSGTTHSTIIAGMPTSSGHQERSYRHR